MKKFILAWAVMLITGLTSAFANKGEDINQNAVASFKNDFAGAQQVSWQQGRDYVRATFNFDNKVMYAYYNRQGDLLGVMRHLLPNQLPACLSTSLKKSYLKEYWVTDLIEMNADGQTFYYVSLENSDETIILKSDANGNWRLHRTTLKNIA